MKVIQTVHGSAEQAKPLVIGFDTVYIHTDIRQDVDEEGNPIEGQFVYHEVQYPLDEYMRLFPIEAKEAVSALENALCEQDAAASWRMAEIENALCEMDSARNGGV